VVLRRGVFNAVNVEVMRLGYVNSGTAHQHSLDWWARNGQNPDSAIHLVRTWAWSPWLQEVQQRLGHALHTQTPVPDVVKELAIVRICSTISSPYELFHHVPLALRTGVTDEQVAALARADGAEHSSLSSLERAVVQYVDEFDAGRGVQDDTFAALQEHLTAAQIVGLSLQVGYWGCNARLTKALLVETEPWIAYTDDRPDARGSPVEPTVLDAVEPGGRLQVPALDAVGPRARERLDSWGDDIPLLARAWSWVEPLCVAEHRRWQELSGPNVELSPRHRSLVARRVAWLRYSPYLLDLLARVPTWDLLDHRARAAAEGDRDARAWMPPADQALLDFIDVWENGLGVGASVFDRAAATLSRRELVEAQLVAGTIGTHARLSTALQLEDDCA
jgi:alkylhydroperoxidase family enzyme